MQDQTPVEPTETPNEQPNPEQPLQEQPVAEVPAEEPAQAEPAPEQPEAASQPTQVTPEVSPAEDDSIDIPSFEAARQYWQQQNQQQAQFQQQQQVQQAPQQPQQAQMPQPNVAAPLNVSDFTDQYGNVDMQKFSTAMATRDSQIADLVTQRAVAQATQMADQRFVQAKQEERLWEKAFSKYPELKDNKELRDTVHNYWMGTAGVGQTPSTPLKAAERIMKYVGQAKQQGIQDATQSVKIQASAHLEDANTTPPNQESVRKSELLGKVGSKDRKEARGAREDLVKEWIKSGNIKLPS